MSGSEFIDDEKPSAPTESAKSAPAKGPWKPTLMQVAVAEVEAHIPAKLSEDDIADHFCHSFGNDWKWVSESKTWFAWDDTAGWQRDQKNLIDRAITEYCRKVVSSWTSAMAATPAQQQKICGVRMQKAIKELCQSDERIVSSLDDWNADDYLLGTPDGVINLKTGKFRETRREDFITKHAATSPKRGPHPAWSAHLDFVTCGDEGLKAYLHRLFGYLLCGDRKEQCFTFMYGTGGNGKGAMLRVIAGIMGDYAMSVASSTFMAQRNQAHTEEMARLDGVRLAYVPETAKGAVLNEERVQTVTGGDDIVARGMGQNSYAYKPKLYLIMLGNFKPVLKTTGDSMKRRFHLFPCLGSVPAEKQDGTLEDRLREEWPQILAWMIEGFALWQQDGLKKSLPVSMGAATMDYLKSEDTVGDWLSDRCETKDDKALTNRTLAYRNFKKWAESEGHDFVMGTRSFFEDLESKGFGKKRDATGRYVVGISLKAIDAQADWAAERD